jgi:regulator of sigma E protease
MIVSLAGPLMNLLFAVIILGLVWWIGYSYSSPDNRIIMPTDYASLNATANSQPVGLDLYSSGSPAAQAGLKTGDRIVSVNGKPTRNYKEFSSLIVVAAKQRLQIGIDRDGQSMTVPISPLMDPDSGAGRIGIYPWIAPIVAKVRGNALAAGLQADDHILSIDGQAVRNTIDISAILKNRTDLVMIVVQRNAQQVELTFVPDQTGKAPLLDCDFRLPSYRTPAMGPGEAVFRGTMESLESLLLTVRGFGLLFQGLNPLKAISGPGRRHRRFFHQPRNGPGRYLQADRPDQRRPFFWEPAADPGLGWRPDHHVHRRGPEPETTEPPFCPALSGCRRHPDIQLADNGNFR